MNDNWQEMKINNNNYDSIVNSKQYFQSIKSNIQLETNQTIIIHYIGIKQLLHRELQLTDTSKGLRILPTIIHYSQINQNNQSIRYVTTSDIITFPFVDATMPFNVMTLVSFELSVMLLDFNSYLNY